MSGSVPIGAWIGVNETALVHYAAALTTRLRTQIDRSNCTHVLLSRRPPRSDRSIPDYQTRGPNLRGPGLDRHSIASFTLIFFGRAANELCWGRMWSSFRLTNSPLQEIFLSPQVSKPAGHVGSLRGPCDCGHEMRSSGRSSNPFAPFHPDC